MKKINLAASMLSKKKERTVETENLLIRGNLLQWEGVIIQISNISLLTTTDYNAPIFPLWTLLLILLGFEILSDVTLLGIVLVLFSSFVIFRWYKNTQIAKKRRYLNVLLNSGHTYSILFHDHVFLANVFNVLSNILDDGVSPNTNYYIDMSNCTIANNSSVVSEIKG